ncbi:hypothetical protein V9L05_17485 [Bernardetia sp. Wsw4-3y2]|uniref:hypothetical protein n=1 Tax=Bernardetia sp. Wsw4-3y2 TaxID=3127471 RepID=UPI0030D32418
MHIHKINSTSQEHQNFLAQNRKDPITGDSIAEGDEVVFCAGCKSVFLKDTWEYLGNRHCEQFETLIDFPSNFTNITINKEENILFYERLPPKNSKQGSKIPRRLDLNGWESKKGELATHEYDFYLTPVFYGVIILAFVIGIISSVIIKEFYPFLISLALVIVVTLIASQEENEQGSKLKTVHKYFLDNVFYVSKTGIGFSSRYGTQEYILETQYIKSLEFHFSYSFFGSNYCKIQDIHGNKTKFLITNYLEKEDKKMQFLESLSRMNNNDVCSISIKLDSNSLIYNVLEQEVTQNQYPISIARK